MTEISEEDHGSVPVAGVTLKDIQSIDYSWGEINLEYHPMSYAI